MKKVLFFMVICLFVLCSEGIRAEIPKLINYQGMLTESDGTSPVEDGTYNLGFKIYGSESGTDSLWQEYHSNVQVTHGLFNVILGSVSSLDLPFDTDYWLEIKVDGEVMPERLRFTSVGYAYRAKMADSATVAVSAADGGGWTDDGSVVKLSSSSDKVGIGITNPNRKLYVAESVSGLSLPLKIDNPHSTLNTDATGILFSVGGQGGHQLDANRGKGALVYEYTGTWNRGDFHFLQDANADSANHPARM